MISYFVASKGEKEMKKMKKKKEKKILQVNEGKARGEERRSRHQLPWYGLESGKCALVCYLVVVPLQVG